MRDILALALTLLLGWSAVAQVPSPSPSSAPLEISEGGATRVDVRLRIFATISDQGGLVFSPKKLTVKTDQIVDLTFTHSTGGPPDLFLNWVLVKPGRVPEVAALGSTAGTDPGLAISYSPDVLANTRWVAPGDSTSVSFQAPSTPGDYPFLCTLGDRWKTMQGVLHVEKIR